MGANGELNVQKVIREIVEKDGSALARKWGEELRANRAKVREATDQAEVAAEIITKKCTKCGEVKALDAYYAHKRGKYGKTAQCKFCARKYQQENKDRITEYARKYYVENKELMNDYARKYYVENKELMNDYGRKYYVENKERISERQRKYHKENPEIGRRKDRKRRALKRSLPHAPLTPDQYERLYEFRDQVFGEVTS